MLPSLRIYIPLRAPVIILRFVRQSSVVSLHRFTRLINMLFNMNSLIRR